MIENARRVIDELARVEEAGDAAPARRALQTILFDMVQRISAGELDVAAQYLEMLAPALPRVRAVLATLSKEPSADSARYAYMVVQALQVADRALGSARIEVDLASVSSESKRDVLRVLFNEGIKRHLSRDDIHKRLTSHGKQPPTATRIGQILVELYALNLVTRVEFARQGNSRTAHYHLTPTGRQLCTRLFRDEQEEAQSSDTWISVEAEEDVWEDRMPQRRPANG
jgi:hypothetical protein